MAVWNVLICFVIEPEKNFEIIMIEAKLFTVETYLYKYNLTVLFVSPSKIAHDKFYIYCPPLLLNEIYAHARMCFMSSSHSLNYDRSFAAKRRSLRHSKVMCF